MRDMQFDPELFRNYMSGTVLDELLCSYKGLPKGVNYMIIGDPGVGKTTIILDLLSNIRNCNSGARVLFISAEMNEIDMAIYAQRFPKFQDLDILFIEANFDEEDDTHNLETVRATLEQGWDIVAIDSFYSVPARPYLKTPVTIPSDVDFLITHGPAYSYLDRDMGCKQLFLSVASARPKYHIFGHVHEEGLQRKAMLGGTTFLNVSYFEELRKQLLSE